MESRETPLDSRVMISSMSSYLAACPKKKHRRKSVRFSEAIDELNEKKTLRERERETMNQERVG